MNKLIGILLMLIVAAVQAEPNAHVEAVQMPAWLQRGESRVPLSVGAVLHNGDKLITGTNARIYVHTADGSTVKLGENATLMLDGLSQQSNGQSLFSAVISIAKGAFRFTTATIAKLRERAVTVKAAGATIGIRGTDVWGKVGGKMTIAAMEKAMGKNLPEVDKEAKMNFDTVCLIEGKISVAHEGEAPFEMNQPQSFYVMPKDAAPMPVTGLSSEQLAKWAAETDISQPASQVGGKWKINVLAVQDQTAALVAFNQWRTAGYDVHLRSMEKKGGRTYILQIVQLPSRAEAQILAARLKGVMGAEDPVASR